VCGKEKGSKTRWSDARVMDAGERGGEGKKSLIRSLDGKRGDRKKSIIPYFNAGEGGTTGYGKVGVGLDEETEQCHKIISLERRKRERPVAGHRSKCQARSLVLPRKGITGLSILDEQGGTGKKGPGCRASEATGGEKKGKAAMVPFRGMRGT